MIDYTRILRDYSVELFGGSASTRVFEDLLSNSRTILPGSHALFFLHDQGADFDVKITCVSQRDRKISSYSPAPALRDELESTENRERRGSRG